MQYCCNNTGVITAYIDYFRNTPGADSK